MKLDALKQYVKLRQQLVEEKSELESRLNEINQVLGSESASTPAPVPSQAPARRGRPPGRRGRKPSGSNTMSMREAVIKALSSGPVARKDLVKAVEATGYRFSTKNPLNSIGSILYNKKFGVKSKDGSFYVEGGSHVGNGKADEPAPTRKKRRRLSPEGRAAIAAAAKARWASQKAGK